MKKIKRLMCLLCAIVVVFNGIKIVQGAEAGENAIKLIIGEKKIVKIENGTETTIETDVAPIIKEGRTFVPVRGVFEIVGAEISWDANEKAATVKTTDNEVIVRIDNKQSYVNGKHIMMDAPPFIQDGRTLIPLRFISENLGYSVSWNGETQVITITLPEAKKEENVVKADVETEAEHETKEPEKKELEVCEATSSKKIGTYIPVGSKWNIKSIGGKITKGITNAFDGKSTTYWETTFEKENGEIKPIEITVDFGKKIDVSGFMYTPRANSKIDGIKDFEIYASENGTDFEGIVKGTFEELTGKDIDKKMVSWGDISVKVLKIVITESYGEKASASEIEFFAGGEKGADIANYIRNCADVSDLTDIFESITGLGLKSDGKKYSVYTDEKDRLEANGGFIDILKYLGFAKVYTDDDSGKDSLGTYKAEGYGYTDGSLDFYYVIKVFTGRNPSDSYVYAEIKLISGSSSSSSGNTSGSSSGTANTKDNGVKTEVQLGAPKYPSGIKTYTEITGREMKRYMKDGKDVTYIYVAGDSVGDDVVKYLEYYTNKGWKLDWGEEYVDGKPLVYGIVSNFTSSGLKMIMVSIIFEFNEVWVSVTAT